MKAPQDGGFILLFRSLMFNGHLQMPEIPFKLFIYLMLQVNRFPGSGCEVGEGWITYPMIKQACCKPERMWADSTISKALDYLEGANDDGPDGQPEVYIRRIKEPGKRAQRIRVLNYRKYQERITSLQQVIGGNYDQTTIPGQVVALGKQECIHEYSSEEEEEDVREVRPEHRTNWGRAYQDLFVLPPKSVYISDIQRLQQHAGITDELIVAVMERALSKKVPHPQEWAKTVLTGLVPYGVTTVIAWQAFEEEQGRAMDTKTARSGRKPKRQAPDSNVILRRNQEKQDGYYDHIYKKFDTPPDGDAH